MKIELKNIGTVKHAEIDLDKNLLIFCGPNNSGKTYVAYTLYGVYRIQNDANDDFLNRFPLDVDASNMTFAITPEMVNAILNERSVNISEQLVNLFASNQDFFNHSEITIESELTDEKLKDIINDLPIQYSSQPISGGSFKINKDRGTNIVSISGNVFKDHPSFNLHLILKRLILQFFFGDTYIAPAERIAINIFSKELLLKRSGVFDPLSKVAKSRYSLPITESLGIAEDLQYLSKVNSDYSFLADLFEREILKGGISVSQYGVMQFNPHGAETGELDIHLSGSMVKSLSSLVFYFRHQAKKGDFIIIDEPELNLHPDNQVLMARILARIVNEGFKVLISTHSDYIIKELNNLIRLKSAWETSRLLMEKYGYKEADLLDNVKIGVYLFKDRKVNNIGVDEFGFEISTIQQENSRLAEVSESIYFELFDNKS